MSLWTKVKLFAEKKEREQWLSARRSDQKCPHCETWQGNCGGWREIQADIPDQMHDRLRCGKCGQWSTWFDAGMVLVLIEPLPKEEAPQ